MNMAVVRTPTAEKTQLRLLVIVDGWYPAIGGAERQARLLAQELKAGGHDVTVMSPLLDRKQAQHEIIDGIPLQRLWYAKIPGISGIMLWLSMCLWLLRHRHQFDAVHVHMAKYMAAGVGFLRPWLRSTLTVKISGAWEFDGGILDPALRKHPVYRFLNWCIKRADTLQCISVFTHQQLLSAGYQPAQLRMIPNAVNVGHFDRPQALPRDQHKTAQIVYVGRLRKVKGLSVLLHAFARIPRGQAQLTIAGDGDQMTALQQQAQELGLQDHVRFLGAISAVRDVLQQADIYVQPSFQEGMPNSVLEAMAMGLPIVATRISGNEDVVHDQDNGLLVPAGEVEPLALALQQLINEPTRAAQMGQRSRDIIDQQFSTTAVIAKLERAYRGEVDV